MCTWPGEFVIRGGFFLMYLALCVDLHREPDLVSLCQCFYVSSTDGNQLFLCKISQFIRNNYCTRSLSFTYEIKQHVLPLQWIAQSQFVVKPPDNKNGKDLKMTSLLVWRFAAKGEGGSQNSKGIQKKEGKIINKAERDAAAVPINGYIWRTGVASSSPPAVDRATR